MQIRYSRRHMMPLKNKIKLAWLVLATGSLIAMLYVIANPFAPNNALDHLHYLGASAGRMMDRHMQFYEGYDSVSLPEQAIHEFLFGHQSQIEQDVINSYFEVLKHLGESDEESTHAVLLNIKGRLAVTVAEKRGKDALLKVLPLFANHPEDDTMVNTLRFAYLDTHIPFSSSINAGANLMPLGWAEDRLRLRIAQKSGNEQRAETLRAKLLQRGQSHRQFVLQTVISVALVIIAGLYLMIRYRVFHTESPWYRGVLDQPWPFLDGINITVTSALFGLLITLLLQFLPDNPFFTPSFFFAWSTLFASLPMVWLIHRYLLKPRQWNFRKAFGIRVPEHGAIHFFTTTGALLALDWVGLLLIGWGTWQLGLGSHWSEGMHERLVFGPIQTVVLSTINIVVWAAIFEEIGFRGLLYTTLRQKLSPTTAIVISALVFSSLHLYSVAGFLSVFWSGLILAYAYERYHSLLPGMVIHAAGNFLSLAPVLLFYR